MSVLMEARDLKVYFTIRRGFFAEMLSRKKCQVKAVDGLTMSIGKGEIVSLVGESGSGKTTLGRALLSLVDITGGSVVFDGEEISRANRRQLHAFRRRAQMIFQDPYQSLNPRDIVLDIVGEPLQVNMHRLSLQEREEKVVRALAWAGLSPAEDYLYRFPHELSGGQRQRVAIAAALILQPEFIVADEPVSMLDVSIRSDILRLIVHLRDTMGISCLCITHDLSMAWLISDRIVIMYLGKVMEIGSPECIVQSALHPYSKALLEVMPLIKGGSKRGRNILRGETPDSLDMPRGCRFHPRCPSALDVCSQIEPKLVEVAPGHFAACHLMNQREEE